jgi:hypothetical protein
MMVVEAYEVEEWKIRCGQCEVGVTDPKCGVRSELEIRKQEEAPSRR